MDDYTGTDYFLALVSFITAYTGQAPDATARDQLNILAGAFYTGGSSALPPPTAAGQILYAVTSSAFVPATPLVSDGDILTDEDGDIVVIT